MVIRKIINLKLKIWIKKMRMIFGANLNRYLNQEDTEGMCHLKRIPLRDNTHKLIEDQSRD